MANVQHSALTDPELHEPKGVAAAGANELYLSDGLGSGTWTAKTTVIGHVWPRGHISRLTLSNSVGDPTNDIDIAAGEATAADQSAIMQLANAITKQSDSAWAVGTNAGGLDTGAIGNGWYHVFLIQRSDTGVVDALFSLSPTAPTMPANYDRKRRIGSIYRTGGAIMTFTQQGNRFTWMSPVLDVNTNNPGTSAVLATLTVPTGVIVHAHMNVILSSTATDSLGIITDPASTDVAPSLTVAPLADVYADSGGAQADASHKTVGTNSSAQVRYRVSFSAATTDIRIAAVGWDDDRGANN